MNYLIASQSEETHEAGAPRTMALMGGLPFPKNALERLRPARPRTAEDAS